MRIIQTFWSGATAYESPLEIKGGWLSAEYHWMSWAYSCLLLRRHYDEVELYTDEVGKKILIDILMLPYTKVHVTFDESVEIHPKLFSLAKIYTYGIQEEPFIHIDGDVFLWKRFPKSLLDAELIASNLEQNLFFNQEILEEVQQHFDYIPEHLKGVHSHKSIFASNAGIIGGSNIDFIKRYCTEAFNFIETNSTKLNTVNTGGLNFLIEQISLYYLSLSESVPTAYFMSAPVEDPLYQDYIRFADVPNVEMVHLVGGCKRLPFILDHLARRLHLEFPDYYYRILNIMKAHHIPLRMRLYDFIKFNNYTNVQNSENPQKVIDNDILKLGKPDFFLHYKRSIKALETCFNVAVNSYDELLKTVKNKNAPQQLKEIFKLDGLNNKLLLLLFDEVKREAIHIDEFDRYKETSNLKLTQDWMNYEIELVKGVKILDLKWNWKSIFETSNHQKLEEIFITKEASYCVTLSYNLINLEIHETYHDGIDSTVLKCIDNESTIKQTLHKVCRFFEEDITIYNHSYQQLVFDVIKRLAYANIIKINLN